MKATVLIAFAALFISAGCCSQCEHYWPAVQKGYMVEPEKEAQLQAILDETYPDSFKTLARVIVRRGNRERAFSILAKVDRKKRELLIAGMTDLGNVMFQVKWSQDKAEILTNRSGWDDDALRTTVLRDCRVAFLPQMNPMNIIQDLTEEERTLRSMDSDGAIDAFIFAPADRRWLGFRRTTYRFWRESSQHYSLTYDKWQKIDGWAAATPHAVTIRDESQGYTARVEVKRITPALKQK